MSPEKARCKGITCRGTPCALPPKAGWDYCRFHLPERGRIEDFFTRHVDGILEFLAEARNEPVVRAIYEELVGTKSGRPGDIAAAPVSREQALVLNLERDKSFGSLLALISWLLETGAAREKVHQLLGDPLWSGVARCDRFEIELPRDEVAFVEFRYEVESTVERRPDDPVIGLWVSNQAPG
ncbi:MAG: hypothetical protein JW900_09910 [Anaerolineae bacterium]|nr:hypothetical protein [Anaerolineae bacterium]